MTRTTDPSPDPWRPLGERVPRTPVSRETKSGDSKPAGESGIVTGPDGKMRTTTHKAPK